MGDSPIFYLAGPASYLYKDVDTPGGILGDAGFNLLMPRDVEIPPMGPGGRAHVVDLEVCGRCMAGGNYCAFQIVFRSSAGRDTPLGLANCIGIVDAGYQGPLKIALRNYSDTPYTVKKGAAIVQIIRPNLEPARVAVVGEGHPAFGMATARGAGGFGSTGGTVAAPSAFAAAPSAFAGAAPSAFAAAAPSAFAAAPSAFAAPPGSGFGNGGAGAPPVPRLAFGAGPAPPKPSGFTTPLGRFAASAPGFAASASGFVALGPNDAPPGFGGASPRAFGQNWNNSVEPEARKGGKGGRGRAGGKK
jgi:dUTP pyrophosphatase